jgi:hypothetical protein
MRIATKAELLAAIEEYPDDALIGIMTEYGTVPVEQATYDPEDYQDGTKPMIILWENQYAGDTWYKDA